MNRLIWIGGTALISVGCTADGNPDLEHADVEATAQGFYQLIEEYDYDGLRTGSSPDFEILEGGRRMDVDDFVSMLQGMETRGVQLSFDVTRFSAEVSGDVGYTTNRMVSGSGTAYLAGFILRRTVAGWLIDRAFSTRAVEVEP